MGVKTATLSQPLWEDAIDKKEMMREITRKNFRDVKM